MERFEIGDKVIPIISNNSRYYSEKVLDKMSYGIIIDFYNGNQMAMVNFIYKDGSTKKHNAYIKNVGDHIVEIERYSATNEVINNLEKLEEKWKI